MIHPRASSLRREFHTRADTLNEEVSAVVKSLPTRQFKMRVKSTHRPRIPAHIVSAYMFGGYVIGALGAAPFVENVGPDLFGVGIGFGLCLALISMACTVLDLKIPGVGLSTITVYVKDGELMLVKEGYEEYTGSHYWTPKSCTELLDENGVVLNSLLSELRRGVDLYFNRIDTLDAGCIAIKEIKDNTSLRAQVQAELPPA